MKRFTLTKAGVNTVEALARFEGDKELYERVLIAFIDDPCFGDLKQAVADGNVEAAFLAAHSLKGVCGNLSLTKLFDDLQPLVETLRTGSFDGVAEQLAVAEQDYQAVIAAIKS